MKILIGYVETSPNDGFGMYCYALTNNRFVETENKTRKYSQLEGDIQAYSNLFKKKIIKNQPFFRNVLFTIGENPNYQYSKNVNVE